MSRLVFEDVSVDAEGKRIVSGVSFTLVSKEVHVLMGQNGSGKSTLVNSAMGHPKFVMTEGKILLDGEDITGLATEKKAAKGLFLSPQYLPEIPGVTLLNFLHRAYKAQTGEEISILDFYKTLEEKTKQIGIDPSFLKRQVGVGLSGGEKKLAEVIQMIALRPKFAFLDEIDSGVDVDRLKLVRAGIEYLRKEGTAFLLITHYDTLLFDMTPDHVYIMKSGEIVRRGGAELVSEIKQNGFKN